MGQAYGIARTRNRAISEHNNRRHQQEQIRLQNLHSEVQTSSNFGTAPEDEEGERRCTRTKCKSCCKSFAAFLFSTVGLVILVFGYTTAGGFLFQYIEEQVERDNIQEARVYVHNSTSRNLDKLWDVTVRLNVLYYDNWTAEAREILLEYQNEIYQATTNRYWDGGELGDEVHPKWNFASALLYAFTAITTIGYGHVTPKTEWGMIGTMLYSGFGLPLTLMCMANLGKFFARIVRILYHTCCCGVCCVCCLAYKRRKITKKLARQGYNNNNNNPDSLEIVGNGKSLSITNDPNTDKDKRGSSVHISISKVQVWVLNVKKKFSHSMRDDVTVPISLSIILLGSYIMAGGLLFSLYDGWSFIVGTYFCFITLTTIGFGDYVPGIMSAGNISDKSSTERLVVCAFYVFLGLGLVGMCIDLMQADVLQKFRWLARKIGIMDEEEKDDLTVDLVVRKDKKGPSGLVHTEQLMLHKDPKSTKVQITNTVHGNLPDDETSNSKPSVTIMNEIEELEPVKLNALKKSDSKHSTQSFISSLTSDEDDVMDGAYSAKHEEVDETQKKKSKPKTNKTKEKQQKDKKPENKKKEKQKQTRDKKSKQPKSMEGRRISACLDPDDDNIDSPSLALLPPPKYSETTTGRLHPPPTAPESYYDDLPSRITTTPLHKRLEDLSSPTHDSIIPAPNEYSSLRKPNNNSINKKARDEPVILSHRISDRLLASVNDLDNEDIVDVILEDVMQPEGESSCAPTRKPSHNTNNNSDTGDEALLVLRRSTNI